MYTKYTLIHIHTLEHARIHTHTHTRTRGARSFTMRLSSRRCLCSGSESVTNEFAGARGRRMSSTAKIVFSTQSEPRGSGNLWVEFSGFFFSVNLWSGKGGGGLRFEPVSEPRVGKRPGPKATDFRSESLSGERRSESLRSDTRRNAKNERTLISEKRGRKIQILKMFKKYIFKCSLLCCKLEVIFG